MIKVLRGLEGEVEMGVKHFRERGLDKLWVKMGWS